MRGTVPSDEIAEQLRGLAAANYRADQITDELEILDGADSFTLDASGTLDNADLRTALGEGLSALGSSVELADNLAVSEGGAIVAALNDLVGLEPILFETGSAVIVPESQGTLDEAAKILQQFPDAAIEVGGHTDSRGGAEANKLLSQSRADAVVAALIERGVTNELTSVGYGEEQLKEDPDDTLEQQQLNRRIEFRIL
ncbi:MAG: OmpA family protein [Acidimicrobiales bacterium]